MPSAATAVCGCLGDYAPSLVATTTGSAASTGMASNPTTQQIRFRQRHVFIVIAFKIMNSDMCLVIVNVRH